MFGFSLSNFWFFKFSIYGKTAKEACELDTSVRVFRQIRNDVNRCQ